MTTVVAVVEPELLPVGATAAVLPAEPAVEVVEVTGATLVCVPDPVEV